MRRLAPRFSWLRSLAPVLALAALALSLTGCTFLAMAYEKEAGKPVDATYNGMDDKNTVIVVYVDPATTMEYPSTRQEISAFVAAAMAKGMPKVHLVPYEDVLRWQDATLNWYAMPEKDIGKHFSAERVIYIELMDYGTREAGSDELFRGHIKTVAKVFEVDAPGNSAAWREDLTVHWPETMPLDSSKTNDMAVRHELLDLYARTLVGRFYNHRVQEVPISDRKDL
jgi:hypothetical protein